MSSHRWWVRIRPGEGNPVRSSPRMARHRSASSTAPAYDPVRSGGFHSRTQHLHQSGLQPSLPEHRASSGRKSWNMPTGPQLGPAVGLPHLSSNLPSPTRLEPSSMQGSCHAIRGTNASAPCHAKLRSLPFLSPK